MEKFDYLVVGSGLYGSIFAHEVKAHGKSVLVVDKRPNIAGNIYTENIEGINVHKYGAHIFHTNNKQVWNYITQFAEFNRFTNSPVANYKGELYSLPFNMYTFNKMWGVVTPEEAVAKIEEQRKEITGEPQNLEEQAISLVGRDIYEKLIKGYTEKQWGRDCKELPTFIIKRLPVRLTFDNKEALAMAKGADAFILCSLGEAIAMSLIENMYIKKLILVSSTMGNKSVINDGVNGYVCDNCAYCKAVRIGKADAAYSGAFLHSFLCCPGIGVLLLDRYMEHEPFFLMDQCW